MKKTNAAIYTRVSSKREKSSLITQLEICRSAAAVRDLEIAMEVQEVVAKPLKRESRKIADIANKLPEFATVLRAARSGEINTLIMVHPDRLVPTLVIFLDILKELRAIGINVILAENGIDFSTPEGQSQENFLTVIAEFEGRRATRSIHKPGIHDNQGLNILFARLGNIVRLTYKQVKCNPKWVKGKPEQEQSATCARYELITEGMIVGDVIHATLDARSINDALQVPADIAWDFMRAFYTLEAPSA